MEFSRDTLFNSVFNSVYSVVYLSLSAARQGL